MSYFREILTEAEEHEEANELEYNDWLCEQEMQNEGADMDLQNIIMLRPAEIYGHLEAYSKTEQGKFANIPEMEYILNEFTNGNCSAQQLINFFAQEMKRANDGFHSQKNQKKER